MLKNKKILLISRESFSFPFYFLAKDLLKDNKIASYFINPMESVFNKSLMNENTYYKHKEIESIEIFDNSDIAMEYTQNITKPPIDWEFVKQIELHYTFYKTINLQILSSQLFSYNYHNRSYYGKSNYEQQIYWLELNYKRVFQILDLFKPDFIFDLDNSELPRAILSEVSKFRNIPYIVLEHPRFEQYKIPNFANVWKNDYFVEEYKRNVLLSPEKLEEEYQYVNSWKEKKNIMSIEYKGDITSKYKRDSLLIIAKRLLGQIIYFFNQDFLTGNLKFKRKNPILFHSSIKLLRDIFRSEILRWYLMGKNKFFSNPEKNEKYVYMPLHLIPESSTFSLAPFYINELFIIEQISKSLPVGWMLYVKEHLAMVGERELDFYGKVNRLPNAKMVTINYYNDPKPWILNCMGVITVTGTSAFEAALLGKRSILFGEVPFNVIEGITRISNFEDLPQVISSFGEVDNIHSCAAYLSTVKQTGSEVKLKYLMTEGEKILRGEKALTDEYRNEILALKHFYEKAIKSLEL